MLMLYSIYRHSKNWIRWGPSHIPRMYSLWSWLARILIYSLSEKELLPMLVWGAMMYLHSVINKSKDYQWFFSVPWISLTFISKYNIIIYVSINGLMHNALVFRLCKSMGLQWALHNATHAPNFVKIGNGFSH